MAYLWWTTHVACMNGDAFLRSANPLGDGGQLVGDLTATAAWGEGPHGDVGRGAWAAIAMTIWVVHDVGAGVAAPATRDCPTRR